MAVSWYFDNSFSDKPIFSSYAQSINNQMVQKSVPVLDGNLSMKNAPKLSSKYLQDKICKIKQVQNISVTLTTFLNQLKTS